MPSYRKLQVHTFSSDFRKATEIVQVPELPTPSAGHVVVKNHYVGINATDVKVTNGSNGNTTLPFGCGLEAVGVVVSVGEGVTDVSVNDAVAYRSIGAFSEYIEVDASKLIETPEVSPVLVPLTISGVSAILALEKVGQLSTNETVFVSAAAGSTGQFVVQLAKLAGNHVIGTCSSDDKAEYLKSLGVDRVINYTKEDVNTVLKTEYPNGLDLVFESVGGDVFKTALDNIAVHGRIIVFGAVASYKGVKEENPLLSPDVNRFIQRRSVSIRGFFMPNFASFVPEYLAKLLALIDDGKIKAGIDPTEFSGLEGIADAIDRLYAKQNIGKLVVKLAKRKKPKQKEEEETKEHEMADSDSDDELMSRLTSAVFARAAAHEDCVHCGAPNATVVCSICHSAHYCSDNCLRRNAKAHRTLCITARMQKEQSEEEEDSSEEEESDSEGEDVAHVSISRSASVSSRRSGGLNTGGFQVPGLTESQIKKLLDLSSKAETMTNSKVIDQLQTQIAQLMESQSKVTTQPSSRDRTTSSSAPVKLKDIKELQKKLQELEKKTQNMPAGGRGGSGGARSIYRPLLVKDDPELRKYFKLKDMAMPAEQIKAKMEGDGVNPSLLDTPDEISPNDPGPAPGAYIPMTVGSDPVFRKYFKLKSMNMPIEQIKLKMEADGVDPDLLDHPSQVSPNDPGPPPPVDTVHYQDPNAMRMSMPVFPAGMLLPSAAAPSPPYVPLLIKDDPAFKKYFKLLQMGMPLEQVKLKMSAEQLDATVLDRPDDVSPNDPGPPPASGTADGSSGPVSMEQLFSILMHHQQIIQNVSSGGGGGGGLRSPGRNPSGSGSGEGFVPPRSVEDQMARELADAESAIDDIFGDEQQTTKGLGGMSMIEQLEKKARKESNKKLVDNRDAVNSTIAHLLAKNLTTDEEAIKFYNEISPKLEGLGLALGSDAVQTWSARLLIKNKDTRDWYFSEQERLDAGKAYSRLWSLSFLDRDAGQLLSKRAQIVNAPVTLRANMKNKPELIDKFTQLLKDTVKLKHKIFKNNFYAAELRRLKENGIPERFEERGTELIDASTVLADAAMDLAEEEFRILESATRAKKIRAHTTIHVAEKAIQLVGIVKKLGARGVNEDRLSAVDTKVNELKEIYVSGQEEEEEEDDVL